jgi:O-methyltransferase
MDSMPRTPLSERLFLSLPLPLSKWAYRLARRTVRRAASQEHLCHLTLSKVVEAKVEGDFLEFGVYRGGSFSIFWDTARRLRLDKMRFFAFDSFAGLPEAEGPIWKPGMFACSREVFTAHMYKAGVDLRRVEIVEGFYDKTLHAETKRAHGLKKAAAIHVDADLYSSTKLVLAFVEDLVGKGTVLLFDDWHSFEGNETCGEPKAFSEWPSASRFEQFYDGGGRRAFVCTG